VSTYLGGTPVNGPAVAAVETAVYVIPTDAPEADGTLAWDKTTMVLVTVRADGEQGLGWSYASAAAQTVITEMPRPGSPGPWTRAPQRRYGALPARLRPDGAERLRRTRCGPSRVPSCDEHHITLRLFTESRAHRTRP
jgi:hypothetical protein